MSKWDKETLRGYHPKATGIPKFPIVARRTDEGWYHLLPSFTEVGPSPDMPTLAMFGGRYTQLISCTAQGDGKTPEDRALLEQEEPAAWETKPTAADRQQAAKTQHPAPEVVYRRFVPPTK